MANYRIVIVDDEAANLESLERILKSDGAEVFPFQDPQRALEHIRVQRVDLVMTDLKMGGLTGLELLQGIKLLDPAVEVILITAFGTVEIAVEAMKKGAYDFITKPLQRVQVLKCIHRALEKRRLVAENLSLKEELQSKHSGTPIIGRSMVMRELMETATQVARSRANVFIEGESGTGKGLLAEYIHHHSESRSGLFVKINCASVPDNLLEAEFFGYEQGAFTGATRRKKGRVELAHGGTLFLDEIGLAPLALQSKLLRFLQDGEFERLGSNETVRVETRVLSATNSNLEQAIRSGQLREDLVYRLKVLDLKLPPLRQRQEDIPILSQRFLEQSAKKNARSIPFIEPEAMERLVRYSWPGNVRELQNLMERLVVLNRSGRIDCKELPPEIGGVEGKRFIAIPVGTALRQVERMVMDETLRFVKGDKRLAARLLGIHPRTIYRYLETDSQEPSEKELDAKIISN